MISRIEQAIDERLSQFPDLERTGNGYRRQTEYGVTELRFLPRDMHTADGLHLVTIADLETEFLSDQVPAFTAQEVQALNAGTVYGAFSQAGGRLRLRAQYSIYEQEPAHQMVTFLLLKALGEQLPLGWAIARSWASEEELRRNRANLEFPRTWATPIPAEVFDIAADNFRGLGLVASPGYSGFVLEVPLSGTTPSRLMDSAAETALLHVDIGIPHPIAGAGYLATIAMPTNPRGEELVSLSQRLNALEMAEDDFPPRLGAWGLRGLNDELVYSCFLPTTDRYGDFHATMMNWILRRTVWLRDLLAGVHDDHAR